jgi:acyl-coenzyme A synthetase/AMP-(fatty) acid ligase
MLVRPGVDFLALSYAVMGRGAVPVFIDPGMGVDAVVACMREAAPTGFIGVPRAHLLRLKAADVFRSLRFCVVAGRVSLFGATPLRRLRRPVAARPEPVSRQADDPALVAFTSGATGRPKGVVFTNRMLTEQLAVFRGQFGFRGGEQDLPLLPVFSLFTAALGVGSIFPPLDPSRPLSLVPAQIIRVMRDLGNQTSFGSPALWTKLADYCRRTGTSLPNLRRVFMAGAPVSPATIELVRRRRASRPTVPPRPCPSRSRQRPISAGSSRSPPSPASRARPSARRSRACRSGWCSRSMIRPGRRSSTARSGRSARSWSAAAR